MTAPDPGLLKLILTARRWWSILAQGELRVSELAAREGVSASRVTRAVRLAFLSPQVLDAILAGRLRVDIGAHALTRGDVVSARWEARRAKFAAGV
ncbi:hypothetical protein [Sphingomonas sp.]|uniref:hypothetical protein n=1 Tax=Sphingomonas sp. TaxID=28214 RepID=UPI001ECBE449|nr:hypothetical protein [Sphingomonas sp.]MBX3593560.1 hypothetical protein [Sphingomonas sp.]